MIGDGLADHSDTPPLFLKETRGILVGRHQQIAPVTAIQDRLDLVTPRSEATAVTFQCCSVDSQLDLVTALNIDEADFAVADQARLNLLGRNDLDTPNFLAGGNQNAEFGFRDPLPTNR